MLVLRPLRDDDEPAARAAHDELRADGFDFLLDEREGEPWPAYVARLERWSRGEGVPDDRVPATFLIGEADGELVGRVSIRHALTPWLAEFGGHVGFGVRPAHRRHGHATALLRGALPVAQAAGVDRALVTCDEANHASAAVIERCGGIFERLSEPGGDGGRMRRYWLPTT